MAIANVTGEVLGTPNEQMRNNLAGDQPKLFTPLIIFGPPPE